MPQWAPGRMAIFNSCMAERIRLATQRRVAVEPAGEGMTLRPLHPRHEARDADAYFIRFRKQPDDAMADTAPGRHCTRKHRPKAA